MLEQAAPRIGQRHAAPGADQQGLAQLCFKGTHLTTERRLGGVQQYRSLAEAPHFGHPNKGLYLLQIHAHTFQNKLCYFAIAASLS